MSKSLNRVQLIGRLGADPQMRYTTSGVAVTTFSVATNRQWTGKDGTQHDETDWHTVVAWDRLAQICSEHLSRGRLVYIEGRMQTRSWEQDGQTRYKTEVVASDMLILDTKGAPAPEDMPEQNEDRMPARSNGSANGQRQTASSSRPAPAKTSRVTVVEPVDDPDDLPFLHRLLLEL
jgi:single-strand DNA-binding protein